MKKLPFLVIFSWNFHFQSDSSSFCSEVYSTVCKIPKFIDYQNKVISSSHLIQLQRPDNLPPKPVSEQIKHQKEYEKMVEFRMKKGKFEYPPIQTLCHFFIHIYPRCRAWKGHSTKKEARGTLEGRRTPEFSDTSLVEWNTSQLGSDVSYWIPFISYLTHFCFDTFNSSSNYRKNSKKTQNLWWNGLPPRVRGKVWSLSVGNKLNITEERYFQCVHKWVEVKQKSPKFFSPADSNSLIYRSKEILKTGSKDFLQINESYEHSVELIRLDISRTFPHLCIFQQVSQLWSNL